jgi:sterol desaturase/sphingolipid hydroxylase (fatty acid hydroxylase superfamily)
MPKLELPTPLPLPLIACLLYDPDDDGPQTTACGRFINEVIAPHSARPFRTCGYLGLTLFLYQYTTPSMQYCAVFQLDWVMWIVVRNLCIMLIFFGGWHHFLYESAFRQKLASKKYNPKDYDYHRDRLWTTSGILISSAFEVGMLHLMATDRIDHYRDFWQHSWWSLFFLLLTPYYVEFHFFMVHKLLHYEPLYRWFHSLHHKSYNPGPWSGLSMHPVEHTIFFTSCMLPLFYSLHPVHMLFPCVYSRISPIAGHDGYDKPAGGSYVHYLHHSRFTVNYGTPVVPLDRVFGSYFDENGRVSLLEEGRYGDAIKENWWWSLLAIGAIVAAFYQ